MAEPLESTNDDNDSHIFGLNEVVTYALELHRSGEMNIPELHTPEPSLSQEQDHNGNGAHSGTHTIPFVTQYMTHEQGDSSIQDMCLCRNEVLVLPLALSADCNSEILLMDSSKRRAVDLYWGLAHLQLDDILDLLRQSGMIGPLEIQRGSKPLPIAEQYTPMWDMPEYPYLTSGERVDEAVLHAMMGALSKKCGLNCDIRDIGCLCRDAYSMRAPDTMWMTYGPLTANRLRTKLKPYSLNCIAALNLSYCDGWIIGAWARTYGVAVGLLPSVGSKFSRHCSFVEDMVDDRDALAVISANITYGSRLMTLCLNVLALFGIYHLDTCRGTLPGLGALSDNERITLAPILDLVPESQREVDEKFLTTSLSTCIIPLGLGQTYWLALQMMQSRSLTTRLERQMPALPPTVHSLRLISHGTSDWMSLPVGLSLNSLYELEINVINTALHQVSAESPAYSPAYSLYGCISRHEVSDRVLEAVRIMLPPVYAYVHVIHISGQRVPNLLAQRALRIKIDSSDRAIVRSYVSLWKRYIDCTDISSLGTFARSVYGMCVVGRGLGSH